MKQFFSFSLFTMLLLGACRPPSGRVQTASVPVTAQTVLAKQEYTEWFESPENTQHREEKVSDKTYRLLHLSPALLALRETGFSASAADRKAAEEHYSDLEYFRLEIAGDAQNGELLKSGSPDAAEYSRRLSYSSFGMQKDLSVVTAAGDSIPCAIFQFERAFDVAPLARYLVAFDKTKITGADQITFVFDDHLFMNGPVKFSYTREELLSIPKLQD